MFRFSKFIILIFSVFSLFAYSKPIEFKNWKDYSNTFLQLPKKIAHLLLAEQTMISRYLDPNVFASITGNANKLPNAYMPENRPLFSMYNIPVPMTELTLHGINEFPEDLVFIKNGIRYLNFLVHPESLSLYQSLADKYGLLEEFEASPFSSHRALVVWKKNHPERAFLAKVSLNVEIGSVVRNLEAEWIERAIGVTALIDSIPQSEFINQGILMIREASAAVPKNINAGFQIRQNASSTENSEMLPLFSLYAPSTSGEPLIVRMIRSSQLSPEEYVKTKIIRPLIHQAVYMHSNHGLMGEPHSQNVLSEIINNDLSGSYYYRDFGGFGVDKEMRTHLGKNMDFLKTVGIPENSVIPRNKDFIKDLKTYLFHGNFYGLQKAIAPYFPQLTINWMLKEYQQNLSEEVSRAYNSKVYSEDAAQIKLESKKQSTTRGLSCKSVFKNNSISFSGFFKSLWPFPL